MCVCVCGGCGGGGGGGGGVKTPFKHLPWPRYRLQYHVCRPVLAGAAVVTNAFHSHNACWYMRALNNNGNEHRRSIKMSQKWKKNTLKK